MITENGVHLSVDQPVLKLFLCSLKGTIIIMRIIVISAYCVSITTLNRVLLTVGATVF